MKLIDFDEKFNRRMAKFLEKHAGERTEEEWEDVIAAAYRKFGDTVLAEIGTTPRRYFADMADGQLVETLKEYLLQDVAVPDLLCEELERRGAVPEALALLRETDEDLVLYAIHFIGADPRAAARYAEMLAEDAYDEHVKEELAENLQEMADAAAEALLPLLNGPARDYALDILSHVSERDERVYRALRQRLSCGGRGGPSAVRRLSRSLRRRARSPGTDRCDREGGHRFRRLSRAEVCHRGAGRLV